MNLKSDVLLLRSRKDPLPTTVRARSLSLGGPMPYTHRNRSLVLMLAAGFVVLGGCKKGSTQSTFRDGLSGLSVTKPDGWYIQTGDELREQARREAARAGDPKLAGPPKGASHEVVPRQNSIGLTIHTLDDHSAILAQDSWPILGVWTWDSP